MKKQNADRRYNKGRMTFAIVLVILFIYLFMFDFSKRVDYQMRSMITDHLSDINESSIRAVKGEFEWVLDEVCFTADYLSQTPDLAEADKNRLYNQLKEKCGFSNIRLVSEDGNVYSQEFGALPKSIGGYTESIGRGESGMTDIFNSSITGKQVVAFYAPVIKNGKPGGGIAGIMVVEEMVDMTLLSGFDSGSYTYVLNSDGMVIMQTNHQDSLYNGRDYFQFLNDETEMERNFSVQKLHDSLKEKKDGVYIFSSGKDKIMAYYAPLGINDWYVVTEVPYDITNLYRERINVTALFLTVKIIIVFLVIAAIIIIWSKKTRKIILDSKSSLELEKKKLELALSYASNTTFEYLPKEDSFTFITPPEILGIKFPAVLQTITENASALGLVSTAYMHEWKDNLNVVLNGKTPEPLEFAGGTSFKEDTWFRLSMSLMKNSKSEVIEAIGTMEDITEEKRIKRRFAQEEQYRSALLSKSVLMWSVNLAKKQVIALSTAGKDHTTDKESFPYNDDFIKKICRSVYSEDYDRIFNMVQINNMLASYYTEKGELTEMFRAIIPDWKDYKWMKCTISLLTEPTSGSPVAFAYVMDVDEETRYEMDLAYSSERDELTGAYNRRNFSEKVEDALKNEKSLSCLMMMDVDNFKGINDVYGHQEGDRVLKGLAQILTEAFRTDDLVSRFGGDEFVVFLNHLPERKRAYIRAEDVCRRVQELMVEGAGGRVSVSIGLAFGPEDADTFDLLYQHADEALYMAKRRGKNQMAAYEKTDSMVEYTVQKK